MEVIRNLIIHLRRAGPLLVIGILLIIYIAFGAVYMQQGSQQRELEEQSAKLSVIVSKPLPSIEELQAEYDEVNRALAPERITGSVGVDIDIDIDSAAIALLVDIAEASGIDISEANGKFRVPSAIFGQAQVAGGNFQLLSFRNIHVQSDPDKVMAFITDLDSGKTLNTMVLKRVVTTQTEVGATGESENATTRIELTATVDVDIYSKPAP